MNKQFCMERSFVLRVLTLIMQAMIIHLIHVHVPTLLGLVSNRSERVNKKITVH